MSRIDGRENDQLRPIEIIPNINKFAEGSCLIRCGNTHVLCTASVEDKPPRHVPEGEGWVTAEYSMLPRANRERSRRDISKLKLSGRSAEIQRLIGRSLRAVVDRKKLGPWNITVDCDVLQGDGGTRTASITGGYVALYLALKKLEEAGQLNGWPLTGQVAAVSAGIVGDEALLDLCYEEDSHAQVDFNCVMTDRGSSSSSRAPARAGPSPWPSSRSWWSCAGAGSGSSRSCRDRCWRVEGMKLVLASKNKKKLVEMNDILSQLGIQVCSEAEAGVDVEVEETGTTFEENSLLKAKAVMEASGLPAIADDSGLCVDALNGAPGVYSARYGGEGLDDVGRYRLLLENMRGQMPRTARFVSVITCCFPNGDVLTARGECPGTIAFAPMGEGGFGYDPVFFLPPLKKTFAQLSPEEKNAVSHRGKALELFRARLEEYLKEN